MRNWNVSANDVARAHSKHGDRLQQNLTQAEAEIGRREAVLERAQAGASRDRAWDKFMEAFALQVSAAHQDRRSPAGHAMISAWTKFRLQRLGTAEGQLRDATPSSARGT